jgi:hypothetical protein
MEGVVEAAANGTIAVGYRMFPRPGLVAWSNMGASGGGGTS